jgi:hypothetical protein
MKKFLSFAALAYCSTSAFAFSQTGPFTGTYSDNFESYPDYDNGGIYSNMSVMGGFADFSAPDDEMLVINPSQGAGWGLGNNGFAMANSGNQALGLFNNDTAPITLTFSSAVTSFGGYWETCSANYGDLNASFYNAADQLIGTDSWVQSGNAYQWRGWTDAGGISSVVFTGNAAPVVDDIQALATPEPASFLPLGLGAAVVLRRRSKKA